MPIETKIDMGPARENWIDDGGIGTTVGIGSVPTAVASYVVAEEYGIGEIHVTKLTFSALSIATVDNGTGGHAGGSKVYDFPLGYIQILGGAQAWSLLTADGTGIVNDTVIDVGIGSTVAGTADETLSGTNENIINEKSLTLSSAVTATAQIIGEATGGVIDGSATAVDAYLNVACTAATADADGTLACTGTVWMVWLNYGSAT